MKKSKPFEAPPDGTPYERFEALVRHVANVPKAETDKLEAEYKRQRARKKKRHGALT